MLYIYFLIHCYLIIFKEWFCDLYRINHKNFNYEIRYCGYKKIFMKDGKIHRLNGPAITAPSYAYWVVNGEVKFIINEWITSIEYGYPTNKLHINISDIENGIRFGYLVNYHRLDGPAIVFTRYKHRDCIADGEWYYEGKRIKCNSQKEFERLIKLKIFW